MHREARETLPELLAALNLENPVLVGHSDGASIAPVSYTHPFCKEKGLPANYGWKIFEVTGSKPGQELALSLLSFTGILIVVGYGSDETSYMLSKLMAFDAELIGTWGCLPAYYPEVLEMCVDGRIALEPFVETRPMSQIAQVFDEAHHGKLKRRVILTPDF